MARSALSAILAAAFVLTPAVKIFAEEGDTAADRETQRQTCYAEPTDSNGLTNWPQGPAVYADSAIVIGYEQWSDPIWKADR